MSTEDNNDELTYKLLTQSIPGAISIDSITGSVLLMKVLDFEILDEISFQDRVVDTTGLFNLCNCVSSVTDANGSPVLTPSIFRVPENCQNSECLAGNLNEYAVDEEWRVQRRMLFVLRKIR